MSSSEKAPLDLHLVSIEGEEHHASRRPCRHSRLVAKAHAELLGELDLPGLVTNFRNLSSSLSEAYQGLASFQELQHRVHQAGVSVTRLSDQTALTVEGFTHAADNVLDDCEMVYNLLVNGLEQVAVSLLKSAEGKSEDLAAKARTLAKEFERVATSVEKTLDETQKKRAAQQEKRKQLEGKMDEFKILLIRAKLSREITEEYIRESDRMCAEASKKEWWANLKCNALHLAQILALAGSIFHSRLHLVTLSSVSYLANTLETERLNAREERVVHLHQKQKHREQNMDLQKEIKELLQRLAAVRQEETICESTIKALENTVATLKALSASMMKAEAFWNQLHSHCGRLNAPGLLTVVQASLSLEKQQRVSLWVSNSFKRRAVVFYSRWTAIHGVCEEYGHYLREAHFGLHALLENGADTASSSLPQRCQISEATHSEPNLQEGDKVTEQAKAPS